MKKIILLFLLVSQTIVSQKINNISIFNRFLILNSSDEIMVVKIENTDFWVTPGVYLNDQQFIKQGLDDIATSYGIKVSKPQLKGVFILKKDLNKKLSTSLRNVFITKVIGGKISPPKGIEKIKWLPLKEALKQITFPHINTIINQIMVEKNKILGGTILQYKEGKRFKSRILEGLYTL